MSEVFFENLINDAVVPFVFRTLDLLLIHRVSIVLIALI